MSRAILLNGVPASGKSTLLTPLVTGLGARGIAAVPLSLDSVKEGLFAHLGTGDRDHNRTLGRASYQAIFNVVRDCPDTILPIVDAWHGFQPESVVRDLVTAAGIKKLVEIWVAVPPEVARDRYRERAAHRAAGHPPASYADELHELAARARPLGIGPVIVVDGTAASGAPINAVIAALGYRGEDGGAPWNPAG